RFMQSDPVEGGNANAYIYPADPVNGRDTDGNFAFLAPVAWFVVRQVVTAVVFHYVAKTIVKVTPPPYRAPVQTAINIASFASPSKAASKVVAKAPVIVSKPAKAVKDVFGGSAVKPTVVHGNSRASTKPTAIYQLYEKGTNIYLKTGITSNPIPENRYPRAFMSDKYMEFPLGGPDVRVNRSDAYDMERFMVMKNPGPLNKERWLNR
ncbi:MAG TPA: hypothetical protein VD735_06730, partial [Candidatus Saccharimonadales bacterium]|nr:hypothetical protein [Candidatus Saccharimonadales bacterium]